LDPKNTTKGSGLFSLLKNKIKNFTGNKVLTEEDIKPLMKSFEDALIEKNVAQEIAIQICNSVRQNLITKKTESFTTIKATVKSALVEAITKLLTPKKNIDILKEALAAKQKGVPYSIVFIGVNGVGKSTSLAKTAYYLKTQGNLKVMIAGCDNFRAGAIEQLK
jgi:signal recognition particle receptor subunit alpha